MNCKLRCAAGPSVTPHHRRPAMSDDSKRSPLSLAALTLAATVVTLSCAKTLPKGVKTDPAVRGQSSALSDFDEQVKGNAERMMREGKEIFRYDTFGSEAFWGGQLRLHQAILKEGKGGTGKGLSARQALQ